MSLLEVSGLSLHIGETPVLKDVSLSVAPGEILALIGESGSGKSMMALAVMQLLPPQAKMSGQIALAGRTLTGLPEPELCTLRGNTMSMVFQEPMTALNPMQPIGRQVAETIRLHRGVSAAKARVEAALVLERVGLPADKFPPSRYPHQLSGGQRQRVVIAIAIALGPRLLIADEPTTALDVTTQAQILTLLQRLAREDDKGMIIISHDLAVVSQLADRIAVMREGEILETGPTRAILTESRHPYTRMLRDATRHRVDLPPVSPRETPLLEVTQATRRYRLKRASLWGPVRHHTAVDNVSFSLHAGERLGLVGESGCGKSTLARALLGLEPLQSGHIRLAGTDIGQGTGVEKALRRRIQPVFQDPFGSFNPRHRVGRLICEPFHLRDDRPDAAARTKAVAEALEAVGLAAGDQHRFIHEFSGGQRQRIAIARALIIRPQIILFDEAVSALDVSVRARILDLIASLCHREGLGYLFISHDLSVVRAITDRVLVMQNGRIVEEGATAQVFNAPQHPYTKTLIAAAPRLPDLEAGPA